MLDRFFLVIGQSCRSHVDGEAARARKMPIAEPAAGRDLNVANGTIFGAQSGGVAPDLLSTRQTRKNVLDHGGIGMKIRNRSVEVFGGVVAEQV